MKAAIEIDIEKLNGDKPYLAGEDGEQTEIPMMLVVGSVAKEAVSPTIKQSFSDSVELHIGGNVVQLNGQDLISATYRALSDATAR